VRLFLLKTADLPDARGLFDSIPLGIEPVVPDHKLHRKAHVGVADAPALAYGDQQVLLVDIYHEHVEAHAHTDRTGHTLLAVYEHLALLLLDHVGDELHALLEDALDVFPTGVLQELVQLDQALFLEAVLHDVARTVYHVRDSHLFQQRLVPRYFLAAHLQFVFLHWRYLVLEKILLQHFPVCVFQLPIFFIEIFFSLSGIIVLD